MLLPALVMVTLAPVAVRLPVAVPLLPTVTLPRFKLLGVTPNWPWAWVPVPVTLSVVVAEDALLVKVSVPLAVPVACGLKVTLKAALWPA